jgi:exodeoxyribonuclease VII small subunit
MIWSRCYPLQAAAGEGSAAGARAQPDGAGSPPAGVEVPPSAFEPALAELEAIVARMEAGELTLEQSLAAYKRGAQLLQFCQAALKDAHQQVKILEAGLLQDFTGDVGQD